MQVPTNQTGKTIDGGTRATRNFKPAKDKPITEDRFEESFCAVLIALIFSTAAIVSVFLTHLSDHLVQRFTTL